MKNNKETILNMYFIDKIKPVEIAKTLNISKSAVTQVLQRDKRYSFVKEDRKRQNQKKHIEDTKGFIKNKRKIKQHKEYIDNLILINMHNQASMELSQKKVLNNMAYRNWNKSAYTYNSNKKRFEFRSELGRSYAVPKYIKLEV